MDSLSLRDHAALMLKAVAKDIETHQSDFEQHEKSKGLAPLLAGKETAATTHGALRQLSGFDLEQLGSEYRALRASVLRLWKLQVTEFKEPEFEDMTRFNEAIDQALAESIISFSEEVDRSRLTFLAILAHDLRGPLSTVDLASQVLIRSITPDSQNWVVADRIRKTASRMNRMTLDLLEYAGGQLGQKIPVKPEKADMEQVCRRVVEEVRLAYPNALIDFQSDGDLNATFDPTRFEQVISNLLINAVKYGDPAKQVLLSARRDPAAITVEVKNFGRPIPPESLQVIFNPLVQLSSKENRYDPSTGVGLGLYIAQEIVQGHGGTIHVTSSETEGTIFTVRLPHGD
ncbi:MAG: HAMP domain-containing sensor histidine kinase [Pyrinomonadaceae bacterium]